MLVYLRPYHNIFLYALLSEKFGCSTLKEMNLISKLLQCHLTIVILAHKAPIQPINNVMQPILGSAKQFTCRSTSVDLVDSFS